MKELVKKLWHSPTFTQWLNLLIKPLRLFLLTPLILVEFTRQEIDVFYILASVGAFSTVVTVLLPNVFNPVMVYFFGGAQSLDEVGSKGKSGADPNWIGFRDSFATLARFQSWVLIPLVLTISAIIYGSITQRFGAEKVDLTLWAAGGVLVTRSIFDLFVSRFGVALRVIGLVALNNRINVAYAAVAVILSTVTILLGGGLLAVLVTQLAVSCVQRSHVSFLAKRKIPELTAGAYSREVFEHIRRPLFRATLGVIFSAGVERLSPALLAGALTDGNFASYSISMGLAMTILGASRGVLESQMPSYTKLYAQGDMDLLGKRGSGRIGFSLALYLVAFAVLGPSFAWFLEQIGAKVRFVSLGVWSTIGALLLLRHVSLSFAMLYNVTNERPFYLHVIGGGVALLLTLGGLWLFDLVVPIYCAVFIAIAPQVIALNWLPLLKFSKLTGKGAGTIFVDVCRSMRPDLIARNMYFRFLRKEKARA